MRAFQTTNYASNTLVEIVVFPTEAHPHTHTRTPCAQAHARDSGWSLLRWWLPLPLQPLVVSTNGSAAHFSGVFGVGERPEAAALAAEIHLKFLLLSSVDRTNLTETRERVSMEAA